MNIKKFEDYVEGFRERYDGPKEGIFTVSGLSGVGTSTIAKILEDKYNLDRYNAGNFFRKEARKRDMDIYDFMENLDEIGNEENRDFDIECDKFLLKLPFKKGNLLIESRLSGVLLENIADIRIWIKCPAEIAAKRKMEDGDKSYEETLKDIKRRNKNDQKRYEKKYSIDLTDKKYYNIILDNSKELSNAKEDLFEKVNRKIK